MAYPIIGEPQLRRPQQEGRDRLELHALNKYTWMRGVAQVTRSQTGKDNVITQIRRDLAPILAKGPLSAKTVEMVQFTQGSFKIFD